LQWLNEQFEDSAFSGLPVALPTREFFPDRYDGSQPTVRRLLDRVCRFMEVAPERVVLKLVSSEGKVYLVNEKGHNLPSGAAGTHRRVGDNFVIAIDRCDLDSPMNLVGTMAHELAHVRLLGEDRVSGGRSRPSARLLIDLPAQSPRPRSCRFDRPGDSPNLCRRDEPGC
jgi:hypothetical protein